GPGAARDDEWKVSCVEAATDAHLADAGGHRDVHDRVDAGRRLLDRQAERPRQPAVDGLLRGPAVEPEAPGERRVGSHVAEYQLGVGDPGLAPPPPPPP